MQEGNLEKVPVVRTSTAHGNEKHGKLQARHIAVSKITHNTSSFYMCIKSLSYTYIQHGKRCSSAVAEIICSIIGLMYRNDPVHITDAAFLEK